MLSTRIPGTGKSEAELELVRTLPQPCNPVGRMGAYVQGSLFKNNYWRGEDARQGSRGSRRPPRPPFPTAFL